MPNGQFYGTYRGSYTLGQPAVIGRSTDPAVLFRNASTDGKVVLDGYYAYLQSSFAVETWVNAPTISGLDVLTSRAWGTSGGWRLLLTRTTAGAQLQLQIQKGTAVTTLAAPVTPGRLHALGSYDGTTMRLFEPDPIRLTDLPPSFWSPDSGVRRRCGCGSGGPRTRLG